MPLSGSDMRSVVQAVESSDELESPSRAGTHTVPADRVGGREPAGRLRRSWARPATASFVGLLERLISIRVALLVIGAPGWVSIGFGNATMAQTGDGSKAVEEAAYYVIDTVPIPDDVVLEVGGMAMLPSGDLAVATRRGEVWMVENPLGWGASRPHFRRFAHGLHEPLGLAYREDGLYAAQRGELTRMQDLDGDGRADRYEVVYDWPVSGNYHEYAFGPVFREDGSMVVTLNLGSIGQMESLEPWRGWMLEIHHGGSMKPLATGMRSPAGVAVLSDGTILYAENQGDWIGSGWLTHVESGDFVGHPAGLRWSDLPESPIDLRPEDVPDSGRPMFEIARGIPALKPPAVWFPHGILGVSTSGILEDTTAGSFGPFDGQLFVGDQGHSKIMRVALEDVGGVKQGVAFPFREGFQSGVLRMVWAHDGSMFVGMTSRGWDATGREAYGLQRLRWSGLVPFEAQTVHARPDGFEITYTLPAEPASLENPESYEITSFIYHYHSIYGSPVIDRKSHRILAARAQENASGVRLVIDSLRAGYIYEIRMPGVRTTDGSPLVHDTGYYTMNRIPEGERLAIHRDVPADASPGVATGTNETPASVDSDADATQPAIEEMRPATGEIRPATGEIGPLSEESRLDSEKRAGLSKRQTEMPSEWERPDASLTIGTLPGLLFDLPAFDVSAGARVELTFHNDDDMLHNLLIVAPGSADEVAVQAISLGLSGAEREYVPETEDVLFHTALLQPGESGTIYFTAPSEPGDYTYVCTFPGHSFTMRGTMRVR